MMYYIFKECFTSSLSYPMGMGPSTEVWDSYQCHIFQKIFFGFFSYNILYWKCYLFLIWKLHVWSPLKLQTGVSQSSIGWHKDAGDLILCFLSSFKEIGFWPVTYDRQKCTKCRLCFAQHCCSSFCCNDLQEDKYKLH